MILMALAFLLALTYASVILYIAMGWKRNVATLMNDQSVIDFSIIIAVKNEAESIGACLDSILANNYPSNHYQIIVVNDCSTDGTQEIVDLYIGKGIKIIHLADHHGKKKALTVGIAEAQFEHILVTDGDCVCPKTWLRSWASAWHHNKAECMTGLIKCVACPRILEQWQMLDTAATMAVTANGILRKHYYLANGANMTFTKTLFYKLGGYTNNAHIPSGDDVFLINEAVKSGAYVAFHQSTQAIVKTKAIPVFLLLLQQRKRWAGKTFRYANGHLLFIQAIVFATCIASLALPFLGVIYIKALWSGMIIWTIKMFVDYFFLSELITYYDEKMSFTTFIKCSFLYIAILIYMGLNGLWPSTYEWKGKKYTDGHVGS